MRYHPFFHLIIDNGIPDQSLKVAISLVTAQFPPTTKSLYSILTTLPSSTTNEMIIIQKAIVVKNIIDSLLLNASILQNELYYYFLSNFIAISAFKDSIAILCIVLFILESIVSISFPPFACVILSLYELNIELFNKKEDYKSSNLL